MDERIYKIVNTYVSWWLLVATPFSVAAILVVLYILLMKRKQLREAGSGVLSGDEAKAFRILILTRLGFDLALCIVQGFFESGSGVPPTYLYPSPSAYGYSTPRSNENRAFLTTLHETDYPGSGVHSVPNL